MKMEVLTAESLWLSGWNNPPWVDQELRRRGPAIAKEMKDGKLPVRSEDKSFVEEGKSHSVEGDVEEGHLVSMLKSCAKHKDLGRGTRLHTYVRKHGLLEKSCYIASTLVSMYSKCGALAIAQQVLDELHVRNVVTWNALLTGYVQQGYGDEALKCFERMQHEGQSPDAVTFICILKACGSIGAIDKGEQIHDKIVSLGLVEKDTVLGNTLLDMYAKCGALVKAENVLSELPVRNVVTWNALIAGYVQHGHGEEALKCFDRMQFEGHSPDAATFSCALKACGSIGAANKAGRQLHSETITRGLESELHVGSTLVAMYKECGSMADARHVFERMRARDVVSWNALLEGYAEQGQCVESADCFYQMQMEGIVPDPVTFISSLKACDMGQALEMGLYLHAEATKRAFENDVRVNGTLVDLYIGCGLLAQARHVVDQLPISDSIAWSALITGYAEDGLDEEAGKCLHRMLLEGTFPNPGTAISSLKVCSTLRSLETGQQIHAETIKRGLEKELHVSNTLIDMYGKCGFLADAQYMFDRLSGRDAVSWAALIGGYTELGHNEQLKNCFRKMQLESISPDSVTFVCILKACGTAEALEIGQEIHTEITKWGFEREAYVGSALVDMYAGCGALIEARQVFNGLQTRRTSLWNALIVGYTEHALGKEAIDCFHEMQLEGVFADSVTILCSLKACSVTGSLETGQQLHAKVTKRGSERELNIGSALVDMYGECGSLADACQVFDGLSRRNVVSWTAMVKAYGKNHKGIMSIRYFEKMIKQGLKPTSITFQCLLAACSHSSLVHMGQEYFTLMTEGYRIKPTPDHCLCMVDLFARSGYVFEAEKFIATMQCPPFSTILFSLLSACKIYGKVEVAERCFQQLVEWKLEDSSAYLLLAAIYANAGMWNDANRLEKTRLMAH